MYQRQNPLCIQKKRFKCLIFAKLILLEIIVRKQIIIMIDNQSCFKKNYDEKQTKFELSRLHEYM